MALNLTKYFYTKSGNGAKFHIHGILFDMDGTLTVPVLDFKVLKRRLCIPEDSDVLDFATNSKEVDKPAIFRIIKEFEMEGSRNLKLQPNIHTVFNFLKRENIKIALITRNARHSVDLFIKKFIDEDKSGTFMVEEDLFSHVLTRDFIPYKPHPASALHVCKQWNCAAENVLFVGDGIDDMQCGKAAGAVTVLLNNKSNQAAQKLSNFNVDNLGELLSIIQSNFVIG